MEFHTRETVGCYCTNCI